MDPAGPLLRGLQALGFAEHVRLRRGGLSWLPPGSGAIEVDVDVIVEPAEDDRAWLSIKVMFRAADEAACRRPLDAWCLVEPVASTLANGAARAIRDYAERDAFE